MQAILEIDDEVFEATRKLAETRKKTTGEIISEVLKEALAAAGASNLRNGFEVLPANGRKVTADLVRKLAEETEDR